MIRMLAEAAVLVFGLVALVVLLRGQGALRRSESTDWPFSRAELRGIEADLRAAAVDELALIAHEVDRYIGGVRVGYVVAVSSSRDGMSLELSDGRRLALSGVAHRTQRTLADRARDDMLRPSAVDSMGSSYRLRLRGHGGAHVELYARRMSLAAPAA
jgi:hypothetical protein